MRDNKSKKHSRALRIRVRWDVLRRPFPAQEDYYDSHWHDWEGRIKDGHNAEEKRIKILCEKWRKRSSPDDYLDDDLASEYIRTCDLTNNMYAALIVSIWSEMERFLKRLIPPCSSQKNFDFFQFKKLIKRELSISVDRCKEHSTINAIRHLNNLFKHEHGYCDPQKGPYKEIEKSKLAKRSLPDRRKRGTRFVAQKIEIDYSKLSISGLIEACNSFCSDLILKVEKKTRNKENHKQERNGVRS